MAHRAREDEVADGLLARTSRRDADALAALYDRYGGSVYSLALRMLRDRQAAEEITQEVFQLWLVAGQEPQSAGVFRPVPGRSIIVPVTADFSRYQVVAISVERGPSGVSRPSAAPILAGTL